MRTGCDLVLAVVVRDLVENRAQRHEACHRVEDHADELVWGGLYFVFSYANKRRDKAGGLRTQREQGLRCRVDVGCITQHLPNTTLICMPCMMCMACE
jgi:hypothetical protein